VEALTRRLLLVTAFAPTATGAHGGARAVHGLAVELAARHDVVLLHLDGEELDPALADRCIAVRSVVPRDPGRWGVRARGLAAVLRGRSLKAAASALPELRRGVAELTRTFSPDIVQVESGVLGDAFAGAHGSRRVLTLYEPAASVRETLPVRGPGLPFAHRLDARAAVREERRALGRADAVVVFTERDRGLVAPALPAGTELATIPLGWDVPPTACDPVGATPPTLLFVGNFSHLPNVDAALTLGRRILPRVRVRHPDARMQIVGSSPPAEVRALAGGDVEVTGAVPSVTPYLERAALVVVPIALGGGMRVKVLEALAAGKAVVASTRAAEGITAVAGQDLIVADGDDRMAAAISLLLQHPEARRRMGEHAHAWALRELSWSAMADAYDALYARLEQRGLPRHA
jgi:glycosyltransferase involved in cell wall biosynthesis